MKLLTALRENPNFPYNKLLVHPELYVRATVDSLHHFWLKCEQDRYSVQFLGLKPSRSLGVPVNELLTTYGDFDGFEPALYQYLDFVKDIMYSQQFKTFRLTIGSLCAVCDYIRKKYVVRYECLDLPFMSVKLPETSKTVSLKHTFFEGTDLIKARVAFRSVVSDLLENVL